MTRATSKTHEPDRDRLDPARTIALLVAAALLSLAACTVALATLSLAVGGSLVVATLPLATLATASWVWIWARRSMPDRSVVVTAGVTTLTIVVIIVGCAIGGAILDGTFDGRWFHREAIIQLSEGWNPLIGDLQSDRVPDDGARARINGYAKAPWILASSVFSITGRMEWSSAFSFVLLVAAAATVFAAVLGLGAIGWIRATAIAVVAACNPIVLCQLRSKIEQLQLTWSANHMQKDDSLDLRRKVLAARLPNITFGRLSRRARSKCGGEPHATQTARTTGQKLASGRKLQLLPSHFLRNRDPGHFVSSSLHKCEVTQSATSLR